MGGDGAVAVWMDSYDDGELLHSFDLEKSWDCIEHWESEVIYTCRRNKEEFESIIESKEHHFNLYLKK